MRDYTNIIVLIVLAIIARLLYTNYQHTEEDRELVEHYRLVDEYLIGNTNDILTKSKQTNYMDSYGQRYKCQKLVIFLFS